MQRIHNSENPQFEKQELKNKKYEILWEQDNCQGHNYASKLGLSCAKLRPALASYPLAPV